MAKEAHHHESSIAASTRYTPPASKDLYESPKWVPITMMACILIGVLCIMSRYIVPAFENTNTPVLVGLGFLLVGLFTATKWR